MDWTCGECERLWDAYDSALRSRQLIEYNSTVEIGLEVLVRKISNRCEESRKAIEDHEATLVNVTLMASATG
jgi:hypothetical protein